MTTLITNATELITTAAGAAAEARGRAEAGAARLLAGASAKASAAGRRLRDGEEGATMVEYGLMVALIAVVALAGVTLLGTNVAAVFNRIAGSVTSTPS